MMKPLSLVPRPIIDPNHQLSQEFSPSTRRRADSLVFSITSQKHFSPRDTILLDSRQQNVSKELESLQMKLCSLENKVQHIATEHLVSRHDESQSHPKIHEESRFMIDFEQMDQERNKQNNHRENRAGRIVKKDKSMERTSKIVKISRKSNERSKVLTNQSRNSFGSKDLNKSNQIQINKLQKAVTKMKQSMQKTERSKSICSERLSASKSLIKTLRRQQKKNQKLIYKLRGQLKKSQNIRDKQKDVIMRQQTEIAHYRQLLRLSKPLR